MRPVLIADLLAAAECVSAAAPGEEEARAAQIVARASAADRYRKVYGQAHPDWGNGTLLSAACMERSHQTDPERHLLALRHVIDAVLKCRDPRETLIPTRE